MHSTAKVDEEKEPKEVDVVVEANTIVNPSVRSERVTVSFWWISALYADCTHGQ